MGVESRHPSIHSVLGFELPTLSQDGLRQTRGESAARIQSYTALESSPAPHVDSFAHLLPGAN